MTRLKTYLSLLMPLLLVGRTVQQCPYTGTNNVCTDSTTNTAPMNPTQFCVAFGNGDVAQYYECTGRDCLQADCDLVAPCIKEKLKPRGYTASTICNHAGQFFENLLDYCAQLAADSDPDFVLCEGKPCTGARQCCKSPCKTWYNVYSTYCVQNSFEFFTDVETFCDFKCDNPTKHLVFCGGQACTQSGCDHLKCLAEYQNAPKCHPETFQLLSPTHICNIKSVNTGFTPLDCDINTCTPDLCEELKCKAKHENLTNFCASDGQLYNDSDTFCTASVAAASPLTKLRCTPTNFRGACGSNKDCCIAKCVLLDNKDTEFTPGCDDTTFTYFNNWTEYCDYKCSNGNNPITLLDIGGSLATKEECCEAECDSPTTPAVCSSDDNGVTFTLINNNERCQELCLDPDLLIKTCDGSCDQAMCDAFACVNGFGADWYTEVCAIDNSNSISHYSRVLGYCTAFGTDSTLTPFDCKKRVCVNNQDCEYSKCMIDNASLSFPQCDTNTFEIFTRLSHFCDALVKGETATTTLSSNEVACCEGNCSANITANDVLNIGDNYNILSPIAYCALYCHPTLSTPDIIRCDGDCSDDDKHIHQCMKAVKTKIPFFPFCVKHDGDSTQTFSQSLRDYCEHEVIDLGITTGWRGRVDKYYCNGVRCTSSAACCSAYCNQAKLYNDKCDGTDIWSTSEACGFHCNSAPQPSPLQPCEGDCTEADCIKNVCVTTLSAFTDEVCISEFTNYSFYNDIDAYCSDAVGRNPDTPTYDSNLVASEKKCTGGAVCTTEATCCHAYCMDNLSPDFPTAADEGACLDQEDFIYLDASGFCDRRCASDDYDNFLDTISLVTECSGGACTEDKCQIEQCVLNYPNLFNGNMCYKTFGDATNKIFEFYDDSSTDAENLQSFCQEIVGTGVDFLTNDMNDYVFECVDSCTSSSNCCMPYCENTPVYNNNCSSGDIFQSTNDICDILCNLPEGFLDIALNGASDCLDEGCNQRTCDLRKCKRDLIDDSGDDEDTQLCFITDPNNSKPVYGSILDYCESYSDSFIRLTDFDRDSMIFDCTSTLAGGRDCANQHDCCMANCLAINFNNSCHKPTYRLVTKEEMCDYECKTDGFMIEFDIGNYETCTGDCSAEDCLKHKCESEISANYTPGSKPTNFCTYDAIETNRNFNDIADFCDQLVDSGETSNFNIGRTVDASSSDYNGVNDRCDVAVCHLYDERLTGCTNTFELKTRLQWCRDIDTVGGDEDNLSYTVSYCGDLDCSQTDCDINECVDDLNRTDETVCFKENKQHTFFDTVREYCAYNISEGLTAPGDSYMFHTALAHCYSNREEGITEPCLTDYDCCVTTCLTESGFAHFKDTCDKNNNFHFMSNHEACIDFCSASPVGDYQECSSAAALIDCTQESCRIWKCITDNDFDNLDSDNDLCYLDAEEGFRYIPKTHNDWYSNCQELSDPSDPDATDYSLTKVVCDECNSTECCEAACLINHADYDGYCLLEDYSFEDRTTFCSSICSDKNLDDFTHCEGDSCSENLCKVKKCIDQNADVDHFAWCTTNNDGDIVKDTSSSNFCNANYDNNDAILSNYNIITTLTGYLCGEGGVCESDFECRVKMCLENWTGRPTSNICDSNHFKHYATKREACENSADHTSVNNSPCSDQECCDIQACNEHLTPSTGNTKICLIEPDNTPIFNSSISSFCYTHKLNPINIDIGTVETGDSLTEDGCKTAACQLNADMYCWENGDRLATSKDVSGFCEDEYLNNNPVTCGKETCSQFDCSLKECMEANSEIDWNGICVLPSDPNNFAEKYYFDDLEDLCSYTVQTQLSREVALPLPDFNVVEDFNPLYPLDSEENCCRNRCMQRNKYLACDIADGVANADSLVDPSTYCERLCTQDPLKTKLDDVEFCTDKAMTDYQWYDYYYDNALRPCSLVDCEYKKNRKAHFGDYFESDSEEGRPDAYGICGSDGYFYESLDDYVPANDNNGITPLSLPDDVELIKQYLIENDMEDQAESLNIRNEIICSIVECMGNDDNWPGYCVPEIPFYLPRDAYCLIAVGLFATIEDIPGNLDTDYFAHQHNKHRTTKEQCDIMICEVSELANQMVCNEHFKLARVPEQCSDMVKKLGNKFYDCGDRDCEFHDCQLFKCKSELPKFVEHKVCDEEGVHYMNPKQFCENQIRDPLLEAIPCGNKCQTASDCSIAKCVHDHKDEFEIGCFVEFDDPKIFRDVKDYCTYKEYHTTPSTTIYSKTRCYTLECLKKHGLYGVNPTTHLVIDDFTNTLVNALDYCMNRAYTLPDNVNGESTHVSIVTCPPTGCTEADLDRHMCIKHAKATLSAIGTKVCGSDGILYASPEAMCDGVADGDDFVLCEGNACRTPDECCIAGCIHKHPEKNFQPVCDLNSNPIRTAKEFCDLNCTDSSFMDAFMNGNILPLEECCYDSCMSKNYNVRFCSHDYKYLDKSQYCREFCKPEEVLLRNCNSSSCDQAKCDLKRCLDELKPDYTQICLRKELQDGDDTIFFDNITQYCTKLVQLNILDFDFYDDISCKSVSQTRIACTDVEKCCKAGCTLDEIPALCHVDNQNNYTVIVEDGYCNQICQGNNITTFKCFDDNDEVIACSEDDCKKMQCENSDKLLDDTVCIYDDDFMFETFFETKKDYCQSYLGAHSGGDWNTDFDDNLRRCDGKGCENIVSCAEEICKDLSDNDDGPICATNGKVYSSTCVVTILARNSFFNDLEFSGLAELIDCPEWAGDCKKFCKIEACVADCPSATPLDSLYCTADGNLTDGICEATCRGGVRFRCDLNTEIFEPSNRDTKEKQFLVPNCEFRCRRGKALDHPKVYPILELPGICFNDDDCFVEGQTCIFNECKGMPLNIDIECMTDQHCSNLEVCKDNTCVGIIAEDTGGTFCLQDSDCSTAFEYCNYGICSLFVCPEQVVLSADTPCICNEGTSLQCADGQVCYQGACIDPCAQPHKITDVSTICHCNGPICEENNYCVDDECFESCSTPFIFAIDNKCVCNESDYLCDVLQACLSSSCLDECDGTVGADSCYCSDDGTSFDTCTTGELCDTGTCYPACSTDVLLAGTCNCNGSLANSGETCISNTIYSTQCDDEGIFDNTQTCFCLNSDGSSTEHCADQEACPDGDCVSICSQNVEFSSGPATCYCETGKACTTGQVCHSNECKNKCILDSFNLATTDGCMCAATLCTENQNCHPDLNTCLDECSANFIETSDTPTCYCGNSYCANTQACISGECVDECSKDIKLNLAIGESCHCNGSECANGNLCETIAAGDICRLPCTGFTDDITACHCNGDMCGDPDDRCDVSSDPPVCIEDCPSLTLWSDSQNDCACDISIDQGTTCSAGSICFSNTCKQICADGDTIANVNDCHCGGGFNCLADQVCINGSCYDDCTEGSQYIDEKAGSSDDSCACGIEVCSNLNLCTNASSGTCLTPCSGITQLTADCHCDFNECNSGQFCIDSICMDDCPLDATFNAVRNGPTNCHCNSIYCDDTDLCDRSGAVGVCHETCTNDVKLTSDCNCNGNKCGNNQACIGGVCVDGCSGVVGSTEVCHCNGAICAPGYHCDGNDVCRERCENLTDTFTDCHCDGTVCSGSTPSCDTISDVCVANCTTDSIWSNDSADCLCETDNICSDDDYCISDTGACVSQCSNGATADGTCHCAETTDCAGSDGTTCVDDVCYPNCPADSDITATCACGDFTCSDAEICNYAAVNSCIPACTEDTLIADGSSCHCNNDYCDDNEYCHGGVCYPLCNDPSVAVAGAGGCFCDSFSPNGECASGDLCDAEGCLSPCGPTENTGFCNCNNASCGAESFCLSSTCLPKCSNDIELLADCHCALALCEDTDACIGGTCLSKCADGIATGCHCNAIACATGESCYTSGGTAKCIPDCPAANAVFYDTTDDGVADLCACATTACGNNELCKNGLTCEGACDDYTAPSDGCHCGELTSCPGTDVCVASSCESLCTGVVAADSTCACNATEMCSATQFCDADNNCVDECADGHIMGASDTCHCAGNICGVGHQCINDVCLPPCANFYEFSGGNTCHCGGVFCRSSKLCLEEVCTSICNLDYRYRNTALDCFCNEDDNFCNGVCDIPDSDCERGCSVTVDAGDGSIERVCKKACETELKIVTGEDCFCNQVHCEVDSYCLSDSCLQDCSTLTVLTEDCACNGSLCQSGSLCEPDDGCLPQCSSDTETTLPDGTNICHCTGNFCPSTQICENSNTCVD